MRNLVIVLRLAAAAASVAAIVGQLIASAATSSFSLLNFFSYFTIQSNVVIAAAFVAAVVATLRTGRQPDGVTVFRGAATVYIATTGVVYNTLLTGAAVENTVPWSNELLHRWVPLYAVLDWLLFSDRGRLLMRHVWWFLIYPAVWLVVTLIRGATDGFVPYPFLNPSLGYGVVALYCVGVAVFIAVMGVIVVALSRLRLLRV